MEEKKQRKPKKSKQRVSSDGASSADYRYFSGGDYVSDQHNNSDSNERKRIEKNSLSPTSSRDSQYESLESSITEQKSRWKLFIYWSNVTIDNFTNKLFIVWFVGVYSRAFSRACLFLSQFQITAICKVFKIAESSLERSSEKV